MRTARRFFAASPLERRALLFALILLPLVRASLAARGLGRTRAWLNRSPRVGLLALPPHCLTRAAAAADDVERMVGVAARHGFVKATCLPRALVAQALLRGQQPTRALRLGVRRHAGRIEAHAWLAGPGLRPIGRRPGAFVTLGRHRPSHAK